MSAVWEFLFKYPPVVFANGRLVWTSPFPTWTVLFAFSLAVTACAWSYLRAQGQVEIKQRLPLLGLRVGLLAVVAFCLLRPALLVPTAAPRENYLAILIDDSRSMQVADRENQPRSELIEELFGSEQSPLLAELSSRFRVRRFRFSQTTERMEVDEALSFLGGRSYLARALESARADLASAPLAGIVLVSDGADHSGTALSESLLRLRASSVPVFTIGVGREAFERDIELSRVSAPESVLRGSTLLVDVTLTHSGYAGQEVQLVVEDAGRIIHTQPVELLGNGAPTVVRTRFPVEDAGTRRYRFRVQAQQGERVLENNQREVAIEVRDGREKILYIEGEPRFEVKFLRRAIADDPQLQVVVLQRTASNKFLRLDVDSASELAHGFPRTPEELFAYRGLILGSIEASFFSAEQLRMIADFVSERGGGLLMLGGRRAFAEGGWDGTPVAEALPLELDGSRSRNTNFFARLAVSPTRAGLEHAVLQVAETPQASSARWASLPRLSTTNRVGALKPGATALLTGAGPGLPDGQVVLAHQRFGRGQTLALPVQDSWLWQMHADVPLEDQIHERFWRQLLRWLISDVPGPLQLSGTARQTAPGDPVEVVAEVRDAEYREISDARVVVRFQAPNGGTGELPLRWSANGQGEYRGSFTPDQPGPYRLVVEADRPGGRIAVDTLHLQVETGDEEFFAAQMRASLLRRIAEETGGHFYTPANLSRLSADISHSGRGVTTVEEREIWDMPIVFFLLVALAAGEWGIRRKRGLP